MRKLKTRYEDVVKEKKFIEEQLTAEKIKYENDILHLNARLTQLQDERVAFVANSNHSQQQQHHDVGGEGDIKQCGGEEVIKIEIL